MCCFFDERSWKMWERVEKLARNNDLEGLVKAFKRRKQQESKIQVLDAMKEMNDPRVKEVLISFLENEKDYEVAEEIIDRIFPSTDRRVIETLISLAKGEDWNIRKVARKKILKNFRLLKELDDPSLKDKILQVLILAIVDQMFDEISEIDLRPLEYFDPNWRENNAVKELIPELISMIERTCSEEICVAALKVLGEINDPRVKKTLISIISLEKSNPFFAKIVALHILEKIDPEWKKSRAGKKAISRLISLLDSRRVKLRENAIWMLKEIKTPRAVRPLIAKLKDKNKWIRIWAINALKEIKNVHSIKIIIPLLKEEKDRRVLSKIIITLQELTGENFGNDYVAWQKWWQKNKQKVLKRT